MLEKNIDIQADSMENGIMIHSMQENIRTEKKSSLLVRYCRKKYTCCIFGLICLLNISFIMYDIIQSSSGEKLIHLMNNVISHQFTNNTEGNCVHLLQCIGYSHMLNLRNIIHQQNSAQFTCHKK